MHCTTMFPGLQYVNLEAPDEREFAESDLLGFRARLGDSGIIDEVTTAYNLVRITNLTTAPETAAVPPGCPTGVSAYPQGIPPSPRGPRSPRVGAGQGIPEPIAPYTPMPRTIVVANAIQNPFFRNLPIFHMPTDILA